MSRKKLSAPPDVPWQEWDFSCVPEDQLNACNIYEYGRHSERVRAAVARIRERDGSEAIELREDIKDPCFALGPHEPYAPFVCIRPHFPKTPFQSIPADERKRIADMDKADTEPWTLIEGSFRKLISIFPELENEYGAFRDGDLTYTVLQVDWRMSKTEILRRFAAWLDKNDPKQVRARETRGAGAPVRQCRKELKALGAWRLLQEMDSSLAWELTTHRLGEGGLFSNEPAAWSRARATAARILAING